MKLNNKMTAVTMALGLGLFAFQSSQAGIWVESGKGSRLATTSNATAYSGDLNTQEDSRSLHQGDRVSAYCPMMKKTIVTTVTNPDGKMHKKEYKTKEGLSSENCTIVLQRKGSSKELQSVMVCPDGTLTPVQCRLM